MREPLKILAAMIPLVAVPLLVQASQPSIFPDVPSSHPFSQEIEGLYNSGVVSGNPDGTFKPGNPVNRAAMLKMLYKARDKNPAIPATPCFRDVPVDAWFAPFVCDAAEHGHVRGYMDGLFKPGNPVTRAEAIKMAIRVMELPLGGAALPGSTPLYEDVGGAWFTEYVASAITTGILPITGQEGPKLLPNEPLERGEAAAYIWNARKGQAAAQSSSSSSLASGQTTSQQSSQAAVSSRKRAVYDDTGDSALALDMKFPFADAQRFAAKNTFTYRFSLGNRTTVDVIASLRAGQQGAINCRLFKLDKDGISTEYYLGLRDGSTCYLLATVAAGDYQIDLQPTVAGTEYTVNVRSGTGDGNDGFIEAKSLSLNQARTDYLESHDFEDWYVFRVTDEKQLTLSMVSSDKLRCLIYPADDVDLYGFSGPTCNTSYTYVPGTYYVGIGHALPRSTRQTYTLHLK